MIKNAFMIITKDKKQSNDTIGHHKKEQRDFIN